MPDQEAVFSQLEAAAATADALHARSRAILVAAVRAGARAGLTQREIAVAVGRSQPEISRLLRFHGTSPRARAISAHRSDMLSTIAAYNGRRPMVFGSTATGTDTDESDIDLLVDFEKAPSLISLARLERELTDLLGIRVEVTPTSQLAPHMAGRINDEATPL